MAEGTPGKLHADLLYRPAPEDVARQQRRLERELRRAAKASFAGQEVLALGDELVVDLFAGGGGTSLGTSWAIGRHADIAINHDEAALAMFAANNPGTMVYKSDVFEVSPRAVTHGRPVGLLTMSPTCTHFSQANSGRPLDYEGARKIRGLAWIGVKWAREVRPRMIFCENVEAMLTWCRLGPDGRANKRYLGEYFRKWVRSLQGLGYVVDWRVLSAADYAAPTIRRRLIIIARCDGLPIVWPEASHGKGRIPYRTAGEEINWALPSRSIFERNRSRKSKRHPRRAANKCPMTGLALNSCKRIATGIVRYVIENEKPFLVHYPANCQGTGSPFVATLNHQGDGFRGQPLDEPFKTLAAARDAHALIKAVVSDDDDFRRPDDGVMSDRHIQAPTIFAIDNASSGGSANWPADTPARTITRENRLAVASAILEVENSRAAFLVQHNQGAVGRPVDEPAATMTKRSTQIQLVEAALLTHFYSSSRSGGAGDPGRPMNAITAGGLHQGVVTTRLDKKGGGGRAQLVARFLRRYYNPGKNDPELSLNGRQGIVNINGNDYRIIDICMRMLTPRELFNIQGFPRDYIIDPVCHYRTESGRLKYGRLPATHQIAKAGNSVCPPFACAIIKANFRHEDTFVRRPKERVDGRTPVEMAA